MQAQVESVCPVTGEPVRMRVSPQGVGRVDPASARVSMLRPRAAFDGNLIQDFCHFIHFLAGPQAAEAWVERHPETFSLSVAGAFKLGQRANCISFAGAGCC